MRPPLMSNVRHHTKPMYFADLTPYEYGGAEQNPKIVNVGWLSGEHGTEALRPAAEDVLQRCAVSKRVNSSKTSDEDGTLIDRVELLEPQLGF